MTDEPTVIMDLRDVVAEPDRWDDICDPSCLNPTGQCDCWDQEPSDD